MNADHFLYPDKMIPTIELISALMEGSDLCEAHMRMKIGAVSRQVFVFPFGISDAGIQIKDAHQR